MESTPRGSSVVPAFNFQSRNKRPADSSSDTIDPIVHGAAESTKQPSSSNVVDASDTDTQMEVVRVRSA